MQLLNADPSLEQHSASQMVDLHMKNKNKNKQGKYRCLIDFCHYKSRPDAALDFQSLKKEPHTKKIYFAKYTSERAWKVTKPKQLKAIAFQLSWTETNRL